MTRQYVPRSNQSGQKDTDSSILQRTAVRELPAKTLKVRTESQAIGSERIKQDLTQIPVSHKDTPEVQQKLMVGSRGRSGDSGKQNLEGMPVQAKLAIGQLRTKEMPVAQGEARQSDRETPVQRQSEEPKAENKTGLPDRLKERIESMSGYDLDGVRVNYNSPKPAQLNALAYTQGHAIEVAPGQKQHLPHEAWHVVQQMQGRVRPTMEINGVGVNGDRGLEQEADVMGQRALQMRSRAIVPSQREGGRTLLETGANRRSTTVGTQRSPSLQEKATKVNSYNGSTVIQRKVEKVTDFSELVKWMDENIGRANWAFTGSYAMNSWSRHLTGKQVRKEGDYDVVVEEDLFEKAAYGLAGAIDSAKYAPPGPYDSICQIKGAIDVDVINDLRSLGTLEGKTEIDRDPVVSLESLFARKNEIWDNFFQMGEPDVTDDNLMKTQADRKVLKELIEIKKKKSGS